VFRLSVTGGTVAGGVTLAVFGALFVPTAAAHSVADILGGGPELRPWKGILY
jgi:hypothetical protein